MKKVVKINESNIAQLIKPLVVKYLKEGIQRKKQIAEAKRRHESRRLTEAKLNRIVKENVAKILNEKWSDTYDQWADGLANGLGRDELSSLNDKWSSELRNEYPDFKARGHAANQHFKARDVAAGKVGPGWDDDNQYERHNILKKNREMGVEEDPMDDLDALSIRDKEWNGPDVDDEEFDDSEFYNDDLAKDFGL